jgi:O-antigen/teichoic acid export membrane protein
MKARFKNITKSVSARNLVVVASGTAAAQAITIAFSPVITRMYGPEAFGLLGVFLALVAIFTPISALTYPIAIVLPKYDSDAKGIIKLSFWLAFFISTITAVVLFFVGDNLLQFIGSEAISSYILLIPITMFFSATLQIVQQWQIRKKQFKMTAQIAAIQSLIINSAKALLGLMNPIPLVLIIIAVLGPAIHTFMIMLGIKFKKNTQADMLNLYKAKTIKQLVYDYRDFPLYRAPQVFINTASQSLPILMLAAFFGPTSAGFYTLAKMVMGMPISLIGQAFTDVFYPKITESANNGENILPLLIKSTLILFVIGIIPFGIVIVFGPFLFGFIFGPEWVMAGEYARWLALFFHFNFINKPSVAVVSVLNLQRGLLIYEIFSTGSKVLALIIGFYWFQSDVWSIALFSIFGVIAYIAMIYWIFKKTANRSGNAKTS